MMTIQISRRLFGTLLPLCYRKPKDWSFPYYRETAESTKSQDQNVHLNPATHLDCLKSDSVESPGGSKVLRVSVIGVPNAGKSTLINRLVGSSVCPQSAKVHTTRRNSKAILTTEDTQVVFLDTPGVIDSDIAKKFKLEDSLLYDPERSFERADLIIMLQDVSNRYVREAIDKRILRLLCLYHDIPSVLVLNKLDTIPRSRRVYDLIRKLTCDQLEGVKQETRRYGAEPRMTVDRYLKRKAKEGFVDEKDERFVVKSYQDLLAILKSNSLSQETVKELCKGLIGWPGFRDVFTISALEGHGTDDLKNYLIGCAKPSEWVYKKELLTDEDPRTIVINTVKSSLLQVLPGEIPYGLQPKIQSWEVVNGVLRLAMTIESTKGRTTKYLLGDKSVNLKTIAQLSEKALQNFFNIDVFMIIEVQIKHPPKSSRTKFKTKELPVDLYL